MLNYFGYYRADVPNGVVSEADVLEMFSAYGENETFLKLLKDILKKDKELYFQAATDMDRFQIRGAHARTYYFISLIKKSNDRKRKGGSSK